MFLKSSYFTSAVKECCTDKPFLATTQNLSYIQELCHGPEKAFTILGSGDSVFQLVYSGAKNITAIEANKHQFRVFALRRAAIRALDRNTFYEFLLHAFGKKFLSYEIFKKVMPYFEISEMQIALFWQEFFKNFHITDIHNYGMCFKGGIEFSSFKDVKESLTYIKTPEAYNTLRQNLKIAKIKIYHSDAIDFLTRNGMDYDWIDISNILIFYYQCTFGFEPTLFSDNLEKFGKAWNRSSHSGSVMILDYMFGIKESELKKGLVDSRNADTALEEGVIRIYDRIFAVLNESFRELKVAETRALSDPMPTKGPQDSILYVTK